MHSPVFRPATKSDIPAIVAMLADDPLGARRESPAQPLPSSYYAAYSAISADPNNELIVCTIEDRVVGVMQLTFIPYLTYRGSWRALIEGVRIASSERNSGVGTRMFEHAIARANARRCVMLQLTTDRERPDALRFYEKLGFVASHHGMKLKLAP
ncbi:GNAT family N-acetyltransferase [Massilia sp. PAMC28688]|uniref:GNAT family N-acetyltransferase n=1 Tax=Massilia sp. PAMC28688 TaxID=2861283 RepID=UPI001C635465|nr:GNAT family N-acetyltransferase [Massilia sp. PAMC28688]QYF94256.1 GNAT family N-acetyltransferase [Massilia sp. PAMC28688]